MGSASYIPRLGRSTKEGMMKTGAKGAYSVETPIDVRLDGLDHIRKKGEEDSMHSIIGDMYKVMQTYQLLISASKEKENAEKQ